MTANRALAAIALGLGAAAAIAGAPSTSAQSRGADQRSQDGVVRTIERGDDLVTAVQVAGWIKERKQGFRIIDLRPAAVYNADHLPTADNMALDSLARLSFSPRDVVVLYSGADSLAHQAWTQLRARGVTNAFVLERGMDAWTLDVMNPMLPDDATDEERKAFAAVADISTYFGGTPATGPRHSLTARVAAGTARTKRGGC